MFMQLHAKNNLINFTDLFREMYYLNRAAVPDKFVRYAECLSFFTFSKLVECLVVTVKLYKSSLTIQPNDLISIEATSFN